MKKYGLISVLFLFFFSANAQTIPRWKIATLTDYIKNSKEPLIVNFWATYCLPCIKEIPYFQQLAKKYEQQGVRLLLVSLDFEESYPERIKNFSVKMKYTAPVVWLDETNADEFCPRIDPKWSGVMPATLLINNATGYRYFVQDEISQEKLEAAILSMLAVQ
jgi:thiol-disulfide isomerase/thioredoxin